jgi:hypothetical protein
VDGESALHPFFPLTVVLMSPRQFQYHRKDWPESEPSAAGWGTASQLLNIFVPLPNKSSKICS